MFHRAFQLLPFAIAMFAAIASACAGQSSKPEQLKISGTAGCSKVAESEVNLALAERLASAPDVLRFENLWKEDHPGSTSGSINRSDVVQVIRSQNDAIKSCYEAELARLPSDSRGRVIVRFIIDGQGHVPAATIAINELGVPEVACCLAERVRDWTFVAPTTGDFVVVEYPFSVSISKS
jgi:hypothetical protein